MELLHYSKMPVGPIKSVRQRVDYQTGARPGGLWVSVPGENDWPAHCQEHGQEPGRLCYKVVLKPSAKLLTLSSGLDIMAFVTKYRFNPGHKWRSARAKGGIDWPNVAVHYDGILIVPFQCSLRNRPNLPWYHGWGGAGGCIWEHRCFDAITLVSGKEPQNDHTDNWQHLSAS